MSLIQHLVSDVACFNKYVSPAAAESGDIQKNTASKES